MFPTTKVQILLCLAAAAFFGDAPTLVAGHGELLNPIARTSIWKRPEFGAREPFYYNSAGIECGAVHQDLNYSTCGRCGDAPGETSMNQGGMYDKGIVVATYEAGSVIDVEVNMWASHYGHFTLELCPQVTETDDCFQVLPMLSGTYPVRDGNKMCLPVDNTVIGRTVVAQVWLPAGVRCERCTLRWTYRSFYTWEGAATFCSEVEVSQTFRTCADIRIE